MLTAAELRRALGPELLSERRGAARVFSGVNNDSRKVRPGELFVALKTETRDGHDFVAHAVEAGAAGLVVSRTVEAPASVSVFLVRNTQTALGEIARYWRSRFLLRAVVVTGSVGKTTTKELIAAVLRSEHDVLKSPANFNDEVGVSMTLLQLESRHDRAVIEVGMFAEGEIRRLCEIVKPDIGVVMNVGPVHLERLGSIEAIARAKSEAVQDLPWTGNAILNHDDPLVEAMRAKTKARVMTFGLTPGAAIRGTNVRSRGLDGVDFEVSAFGRTLQAHSPLPGADLVPNALAALAVAFADGMSLEQAVKALREARVPARLQVKRARSGALVLDDCYNASPASMFAALAVLAETKGRHIALLGDMLELGAAEADSHRAVGRRAAEVAQVLYTVGTRAEMIGAAAREAGAPCVRHFDSKEEAAAALAREAREGDVVLVKASHGMALESVVAELVG
ncbi:MAG TPA: UDP-N-acetylmuramoyl-tripeptide--D-alanyl-D-alanine ligase [Dehalococcoidia bacterium]|nr:UDP-N-acetylmuramoyl-tripeptide--D-alanyl-D-alanine ligase [Dehalococcoidia bacterium]